MMIFHADLDNTLIYSYKKDIGSEKRCVEVYQGREISFMTEQTYRLLREVSRKFLFVPTTTRTEEQYRRIDLGVGVPEYALVCNGGVLLKGGKEDVSWYRETMASIQASAEQLKKAERLMAEDESRSFEVRNIRSLFLFTKSSEPEKTAMRLRNALDPSLVSVFTNGVKVYVLPVDLDKGKAVSRLRRRLQPELVLAAGDSLFDVPMLEAADVGFAPAETAAPYAVKKGRLFSEEVLWNVLKRSFCALK